MPELQAKDGTPLNVVTWPASGSARGVVVLVHGYGEHIARYDHVGRALAEAGLTVVGADTRGHGKSGGARGFCTRFDEYLDDLAVVAAHAAGDRPYQILAHSFGGVISAKFLLARKPSQARALALSSPFFALKLAVPKARIFAGKVASAVFPKLALPTGLRGADVSRDPEMQAVYDSDPLNNKNATARWFTETTRAQAEIAAQAPSLTLPVLLAQGAADHVASPEAAERVVRSFGSADKTIHMLAGQFHEIFNEPADDRQKAIALVRDWLVAHAAA